MCADTSIVATEKAVKRTQTRVNCKIQTKAIVGLGIFIKLPKRRERKWAAQEATLEGCPELETTAAQQLFPVSDPYLCPVLFPQERGFAILPHRPCLEEP